jgi:hypothetical protein
LTVLHPGQLNAALTAVADALRGQGQSLGQSFVAGSNYLQYMQPLWPQVVADLNLLDPFAAQLAMSSGDLLGILAHQTVTSQTVTTNAAAVQSGIAGGGLLASQTSQLLTAIQQPFSVLTAAAAPFFQDLSSNPNEISQLFNGLDGFARAVVAAESAGPYLSATATVTIVNPANLALAAFGGPGMLAELAQGLGPGIVNPPTYTAADCPAFGALSRCAGVSAANSVSAANRAAAAASTMTGGPAAKGASAPSGPFIPPVPVLPEPQQQRAVASVAAAISGAPPASAAVATLLLSPLLEGLSGPS